MGEATMTEKTRLDALEAQLRETRNRFAVGEATRADVAQAEARLATSQAWPIREAYFAYAHLPPNLQIVGARFYGLAQFVVNELPDCAERTVVLRKLLEAKDAAVRAKLPEEGSARTMIGHTVFDPDKFNTVSSSLRSR